MSVVIYSNGVSIFTALAEGLKGKIQSSFEKAYELDKMMVDAGPILSLGRFWSVLHEPYYYYVELLKSVLLNHCITITRWNSSEP